MRSLIVGVFAAAFITLFALPAAAHVAVVSTSIAQNGTLAHTPETLTVTFNGATALAGVTLEKADGSSVPLDFSPSRAPAPSFSIPLPKLEAGRYTLRWRTMSSDGHVVPGSIAFTVAAT